MSILTLTYEVVALVIGVVDAKGGSGKTTLATNVARAIQLDGNDVALVDTDPQKTAATWEQNQPEGYGLPVFDSRTSQRMAHAEAMFEGKMFEGKMVLDVSGTGKAEAEIQGITSESGQLLRFG